MKIRIKFEKQGVMKFIGHLDIMRYFQKVMRRAQVDIRYSEGFSPHQLMSFAAPLGVGITSKGEYLDIEVVSTENSETMVRRLNEVMTEGMRVLSYRRLPDNARNAMSIVAAADYTLTFRNGREPEDMESFFLGFMSFYRQRQIFITKKTKRGEKEIDLKPLIYQLYPKENSIFMKVSTGSRDNVKPELVMEAYAKSRKSEYLPFAIQLEREEIYADLSGDAGNETEKNFISLEALGEDIM